MNILLIGYCHLADGFLYASKALEGLNHNVFFFPYLSYKMDNRYIIEDFNKMIDEKKIHICLWWNNSIEKEDFIEMYKNKENYIHISYNWDPYLLNPSKYNTQNWSKRIEDKKYKYQYMNYIFSCFGKEIDFFNNDLYKNKIFYNPPGFDKTISYYNENEEYKCDISIVSTNLYNDNNEFPFDATNITRYEIVEYLYSVRNSIRFHFYGPEKFKEIYPECYKGSITYDECFKVFSNSKINLSIHPIIFELHDKDSEKEYFSERVPQILGCRGLLMSNSYYSHILKPNQDYIQINKTNYKKKIKDILKKNNDYDIIRNNGYKKALLNYQWNNWATKINNIIC